MSRRINYVYVLSVAAIMMSLSNIFFYSRDGDDDGGRGVVGGGNIIAKLPVSSPDADHSRRGALQQETTKSSIIYPRILSESEMCSSSELKYIGPHRNKDSAETYSLHETFITKTTTTTTKDRFLHTILPTSRCAKEKGTVSFRPCCRFEEKMDWVHTAKLQWMASRGFGQRNKHTVPRPRRICLKKNIDIPLFDPHDVVNTTAEDNVADGKLDGLNDNKNTRVVAMLSARYLFRCVVFQCRYPHNNKNNNNNNTDMRTSSINVVINHDISALEQHGLRNSTLGSSAGTALDAVRTSDTTIAALRDVLVTQYLGRGKPIFVQDSELDELKRRILRGGEQKTQKTPPKHTNVIYLFLDGASHCLSREFLPKFYERLRTVGRHHLVTGGDFFVPLGSRTIHNAPAMLSGWLGGDSWLHIDKDPKKPINTKLFPKLVSDSLFSVYKRNGYVTHAAGGNELVDVSAGFNGIWSGHTFIDVESFDLSAEFASWKSVCPAVGQKHVMEYAVDSLLDLWRRVGTGGGAAPIFSLLYDASAHFPHMDMLQFVDVALIRLLDGLEELGVLDSTAIVVMSDHLPHSYRMATFDVVRDSMKYGTDKMLGELWMPSSLSSSLPSFSDVATPSFTTHFDWYRTISELSNSSGSARATGGKFNPRPESNLLRSDSTHGERSCISQGVPVEWCPYQKIEIISRNNSVNLIDKSEVNQDVRNSTNSNNNLKDDIDPLVRYVIWQFKFMNAENKAMRRWCPSIKFNKEEIAKAMLRNGVEVLSADGRRVYRSRFTTVHANAGGQTVLWEAQYNPHRVDGESEAESSSLSRISPYGHTNARCVADCRSFGITPLCFRVSLPSCICHIEKVKRRK
eukprot:PhM_4_TR2676/c0_g1_i1/m.26961